MSKLFFDPRALLVILSSLSVLGACTKGDHRDLHKEPNVELLQDMMEQDALKAQDFEPLARETGSSRLPPEGTVPLGFKPYAYHLNPQAAAANLKNPYAGRMDVETLSQGRKKFETYCAVCHGYEGKGDGPVSVKMALKPPPLISEKITKLVDGGIFHIISDGQGVMSSYAYQLVDENDRWAIVNYVRSLQRLASGANTANNASKGGFGTPAAPSAPPSGGTSSDSTSGSSTSVETGTSAEGDGSDSEASKHETKLPTRLPPKLDKKTSGR